jgi:hypothetical protein
MSDYEVTLINDNMQEFYVRYVAFSLVFNAISRFHGPKDSMCKSEELTGNSTFCRWSLEGSRRVARPISLQVALNRIHEQNLSSKH